MIDYLSIFKKESLSTDFDSYLSNNRDEQIKWSVTIGYADQNPHAFPNRIRRGYNDDIKSNLRINRSDSRNFCPSMKESYKLIMHQPHEMPTEFHEYQTLGLEVRHVLTFAAHVHRTDVNLASYPATKRGCYFSDERWLKYFKNYTKAHCDSECFANFTLKTCGCSKFSMPRTQNTPVCGLNDTKCLMDVVRTWAESEELKKNGNSVLCSCLPECNRIDYEFKSVNIVDYVETRLRLKKIMSLDLI